MQAKTAIRSRLMRLLASHRLLEIQCNKARWSRRLRGRPPEVHYFHQVDDPYSHLCVQKLAAFAERYAIRVVPHLVSGPSADFQGDAERFPIWASRDAAAIAPGYGTTLAVPHTHGGRRQSTTDKTEPSSYWQTSSALSRAIESQLAELLQKTPADQQAQAFAAAAFDLGSGLWRGEQFLEAPAAVLENRSHANAPTASGDRLRKKLGHYQGAMFWFDGEWYWGLDRLHLLETRLIAEGFGELSPAESRLVAPVPIAEPLPRGADASVITLEYFPSLRSPYTAIGQSRVVDLVSRTGVQLALKPVMPMMMRGIPAPRPKQRYIIQDASREARYYRIPFGNFVDPFGEPVKRAFALYPAASRLGRGMEFVSAYLSAAFAVGIDVSGQAGLAAVADAAGLEFDALTSEASGELRDGSWQTTLETNVQEMLHAGLWGVPSFRLTGGNSDAAFTCWGQDRIWLIESEITRRCR